MGWNNPGTVTVNKLIVEGTDQGVFVYNGTPTLGNLILSITSSAGTDTYGNIYYPGMTLSADIVPYPGIAGITWVNQQFHSDPTNPPFVFTQTGGGPSGNDLLELVLQGPQYTDPGSGATSLAQISLQNDVSAVEAYLNFVAGQQADTQTLVIRRDGFQFDVGPLGRYYAERYTKAAQALSGAGWNTLTGWTSDPNFTFSGYPEPMVSATGHWTCPATGFYDFSLYVGGVNGQASFRVYDWFTSAQIYGNSKASSGSSDGVDFSGVIPCTQGNAYSWDINPASGSTADATTNLVIRRGL